MTFQNTCYRHPTILLPVPAQLIGTRRRVLTIGQEQTRIVSNVIGVPAAALIRGTPVGTGVLIHLIECG